MLKLDTVRLSFPEGANIVLGQSHFIKTVEDLYEAMVGSGPHLKFGIAFSEASGPCLIRVDGNDDALKQVAADNVKAIASGHCFLIVMQGGFPINVLQSIHRVPEVCNVFCATANPVEVIVAETDQGRGIMGVIDGSPPKGIESEAETQQRHDFLRKICYKR